MRELIYSDTPDANRAGQISHVIACGLRRRNLDVHIAQAQAGHALIRQQTELGVRQLWLIPDSIYLDPVNARAFADRAVPHRVCAAVAPIHLIHPQSVALPAHSPG